MQRTSLFLWYELGTTDSSFVPGGGLLVPERLQFLLRVLQGAFRQLVQLLLPSLQATFIFPSEQISTILAVSFQREPARFVHKDTAIIFKLLKENSRKSTAKTGMGGQRKSGH